MNPPAPEAAGGPPLRILLHLGRLDVGGAERQFTQLANGLAARGHEVHFATLYPGGDLAAVLAPDVRTHALTPSGSGRLRAVRAVGAARRLRRLAERLAPDVAYSALYFGNALAHRALHGTGVPHVWGLRTAGAVRGRRHARAFEYGRHHAGAAALAIYNSEAGRRFHEERGCAFRASCVLPNGTDVERFRADSAAGGAHRASLGIPADAFVAGFVGRLAPEKDLPTFLRAARRLADRWSDARFVVVGGGPAALVSELRALARSLGIDERVHWTGAQRDLPPLYNAFDVATSTSEREGFPNAVAEAMSCGVPCVVTDVGDSARLVGDAGIVARPRTPEAVAEAWFTLAAGGSAHRSELGRRAADRIRAEFSLEACLSGTEAALRAVALRRAPGGSPRSSGLEASSESRRQSSM